MANIARSALLTMSIAHLANVRHRGFGFVEFMELDDAQDSTS